MDKEYVYEQAYSIYAKTGGGGGGGQQNLQTFELLIPDTLT